MLINKDWYESQIVLPEGGILEFFWREDDSFYTYAVMEDYKVARYVPMMIKDRDDKVYPLLLEVWKGEWILFPRGKFKNKYDKLCLDIKR